MFTNSLQSLRAEHFAEESLLRKRKFKMATELRNWIGKYDQDMGWRQEEVEELETQNQHHLEQIQQLQVHFEKVNILMKVILIRILCLVAFEKVICSVFL